MHTTKFNTTMNNDQLREQKRLQLEKVEIQFYHWLGVATLFGLIVIPLIPASLTFMAIKTEFPVRLNIPIWMAIAIATFAALGIEFLGLGALKLALQMRKFNVTIAKAGLAHEHAPLRQGTAVAIIYVSVVLSLTFLLKMKPEFAIWSLIPLALMGALVDWYFALKSDQEDREAKLRAQQIAQQRKEDQARENEMLRAKVAQLQEEHARRLREAEQRADAMRRQIAQLKSGVPAQPQRETPKPPEQIPELNETQLAIVRVITRNPRATQAEIAEEVDVTPATISRNMKPLKASGAIDQTTDGWKVSRELQVNGAAAHG